jgi:hypothetical protein
MMVNVYDLNRMSNGSQDGAYTSGAQVTFAFSPKQTFLRVTKLVIATSAYTLGQPGSGFHFIDYEWLMNNSEGTLIASDHFELFESNPACRNLIVTDSSILSMITPGLNFLYFSCPDYVFLLKVNVFVEYQYQS